MTVSVLAFAAASAQGAGTAAIDVSAAVARAPCHVRLDVPLRGAGVRQPFVARAQLEGEGDRARLLVNRVARELSRQMHQLGIRPVAERTRVYIGTSSGGMQMSALCAHAWSRGEGVTTEQAAGATYFGPLLDLTQEASWAGMPIVQVLSACASSTIALGLGLRAVQLGEADLVIAGGYDAVTPFVAAGFESLGATSQRPLPYRNRRDGLALGEGAALLLLGRAAPGASLGSLTGFAATSDAFHVTQPHPEGRGLIAAARRALADAGLSDVELVSGHGTATPLNDAREALAIRAAFKSRPIVYSFKGSVGHTLGAAGALESLSALQAMQNEVYPATTGPGEVIADLAGQVLDTGRSGVPRSCLKLSAAFGGANAALVWTHSGAAARAARTAQSVALLAEPVLVTDAELSAHPLLSAELSALQRFDPISRLAIAAALSACTRSGQPLPRDAAVVLGTAGATLELNAAFELERCQRGAQPRRFPPTSPNLAPCAVSIALGLEGPAFAVGASDAAGVEAAVVAADLIAAGDAPAALVIALEWPGAFLAALWGRRGCAPLVLGATACILAAQAPPGSAGQLNREALHSAWTQDRLQAPGATLRGLCEAVRAACG